MGRSPDLSWQPSLFGTQELVTIDADLRALERVNLDAECWVDHIAGWVQGSDALFETLLEGLDWGQRSRRMYDQDVTEPRLTALWRRSSGTTLEPAILERTRTVLSRHYGIEFDSAGFNLYRDGHDSVAWHGDRIRKGIEQPLVALVSVGEPRRFLLKPREGGSSRAFMLGRGDLLVTGGRTQRTWLHSIPKVASAGPRISIAFRHGLDPSIYDNSDATPEET